MVDSQPITPIAMPDVSLFTATEPVASDIPVIIRYSVEVGGLPVYNESYDVDKLAAEFEEDEEKAATLWLRRLKCVIAARKRGGFSAALTRCLVDGVSCEYGSQEPQEVDSLKIPS